MFVQSLMLSMLCNEALDLNASEESLVKSDNVNKGQQQQQEDAEAEAQAETLLNRWSTSNPRTHPRRTADTSLQHALQLVERTVGLVALGTGIGGSHRGTAVAAFRSAEGRAAHIAAAAATDADAVGSPAGDGKGGSSAPYIHYICVYKETATFVRFAFALALF